MIQSFTRPALNLELKVFHHLNSHLFAGHKARTVFSCLLVVIAIVIVNLESAVAQDPSEPRPTSGNQEKIDPKNKPSSDEAAKNDPENKETLKETPAKADPKQAEERVADSGDQDKLPTITIGSKAPSLAIEHWISDGNGKFKPVTEFETGRIYVVDLWSTRHLMSLVSILRLSELQTEFSDKVQIISVSEEDLETVQEFLQQEIERKETTYAELSKNYCVAADPDGSVTREYLIGLAPSRIPVSVIVGKEGLIEWIGHPTELNEPLRAVVDGTWDREAYQNKLKDEELARDALMKKSEKREAEETDEETEVEIDEAEFSKFMEVIERAGELAESGEVDEALSMLDKAVANAQSDDVKQMFRSVRHQFAMIFLEGEEAVKALIELIQEHEDDSDMLGNMLSMVCSVHEEKPIDPEVLKLVRETAEQAVKDDDSSLMLQYALGQILDVYGEVEPAIAATEKAITLLDEFEPEGEEEESYIAILSEEIYAFMDKLKEKKAKSPNTSDDDTNSLSDNWMIHNRAFHH